MDGETTEKEPVAKIIGAEGHSRLRGKLHGMHCSTEAAEEQFGTLVQASTSGRVPSESVNVVFTTPRPDGSRHPVSQHQKRLSLRKAS